MKRLGLNLRGRCMVRVIDIVDAVRELELEPVEEYDRDCDRFLLRFLYKRPDRYGRMQYAELGDVPIEVSSDGVEIVNVEHIDFLLQRMPPPLPKVDVAEPAPHEHQDASREAADERPSDLGDGTTEEQGEDVAVPGAAQNE